MLTHFKEQLLSPFGMNIVNFCFALAVFLFNPLTTILVFGIWLVFLTYSIRHTPYKSTKVFYSLLVVFALLVIACNGYALLGLPH